MTWKELIDCLTLLMPPDQWNKPAILKVGDPCVFYTDISVGGNPTDGVVIWSVTKGAEC